MNPPIHGQKSVVVDLDGVVADFTRAFTELAAREFRSSIPIIPTIFHQAWNFVGIMSPQEVNATWEYIHSHPDWWGTFQPLIFDALAGRLAYITTKVPTYFVTHRPDAAHKASIGWLIHKLGIDKPTVIMSKKKGEIARVLGATHAIDDKLENCWCIHWLSDNPQTKVYLLDRPYNRIDMEVGVQNLYRIKNFEEFMDDLEGNYA